jgi:MFS family permease
MVAITAVMSTVTAITMGTLSDRTRSCWGRRKPYLLFGYLAWGAMTAIFPTAALFQPVGMAIFMAILLDCVMAFFGATANDAAFGAYMTEASTQANRGRVMSVMQILAWVATLLVYASAGPLIDQFGYFNFFYAIGGLVFVFGLVGGLLVQGSPTWPPRPPHPYSPPR